VTPVLNVRARVVVLATAGLLLLTAAARAEIALTLGGPVRVDLPATASIPGELVTAFDGSSIASVPVDVVPASDRPVVTGGAKRADGQRAPSMAPTGGGAATASVRFVWDLPLHGSLTSVGPVALGLTRRGPPTASDR
jgi:hypothetical protein